MTSGEKEGVEKYLPHFLVLGAYLLLGVRFFALISRVRRQCAVLGPMGL